MTEKDIIKVTVAVERIRFYKNEWGIIECSIDPKRIKQGTPKLDKNGTLTSIHDYWKNHSFD